MVIAGPTTPPTWITERVGRCKAHTAGMSYDLAVWVGKRPANDAAAAEEFDARIDASESNDDAPGPLIQAFVAELLERFPEGSDDGVWAVEPVLDDVGGDFQWLNMVVGEQLDELVEHAGELARVRGLVAYDPQRESLL
jgi:hypothetical protein